MSPPSFEGQPHLGGQGSVYAWEHGFTAIGGRLLVKGKSRAPVTRREPEPVDFALGSIPDASLVPIIPAPKVKAPPEDEAASDPPSSPDQAALLERPSDAPVLEGVSAPGPPSGSSASMDSDGPSFSSKQGRSSGQGASASVEPAGQSESTHEALQVTTHGDGGATPMQVEVEPVAAEIAEGLSENPRPATRQRVSLLTAREDQPCVAKVLRVSMPHEDEAVEFVFESSEVEALEAYDRELDAAEEQATVPGMDPDLCLPRHDDYEPALSDTEMIEWDTRADNHELQRLDGCFVGPKHDFWACKAFDN